MRSFAAQTLHYFARPHASVRREPVHGPEAWHGGELDQNDWLVELATEEVDILRYALRSSAASGVPVSQMTRADFPLGKLERRVTEWRQTVHTGRGFVLVRGLPVTEWSDTEAERVFWGLGLHLGIPGGQNPAGDLVGHVRDERLGEDADVRLYRTSADIAYHCDAADIVGLLCLQPAKSGGESRLASSAAVYSALLAEHPEWIPRLYAPFALDAHGERGVSFIPMPACAHAEGRLRTFYHSDYFRSGARLPGAPHMSEDDWALLDRYDEIASSQAFRLDMTLRPGDLQLVSNHSVIHARAGYEDHDDPVQRRHLLRLWLSVDEPMGAANRMRVWRRKVQLITSLAAQRVRGRLRR